MKFSQIITYLFLLCLIGGATLELVMVLDCSESVAMEQNEPFDGEKEEQKKNEEKFKKRSQIDQYTGSLMSNALAKVLMTTVDLQSLYHPEITTPPPELT